MLTCPYCIHIKYFVILRCCGLDWYILFTPIPAPSVCLILAKSGLLFGGCRLCQEAMVVQDGQGHVIISMLYSYRVLCNLVVIWISLTYLQHTNSIPEYSGLDLSTSSWDISGWVQGVLTSYCGPRWSNACYHTHVEFIHKVLVLWIGLLHPIHTHSSPKCMPDFGQIWAIVGRVKTMLGGNGGPRWSGSCFHIHAVSIQSSCKLMAIWFGLKYPQHTHSIPEYSVPDLSTRIWAIAGQVQGVLTRYCGPRWSRTCCHVHVASMQGIL